MSEAICKLTPIKYENDTKFQPSDVFVDYSHCSIAIEFAVTKNKHLNGMLQKQLISKRYENLKKKKVLKYKHKSLRWLSFKDSTHVSIWSVVCLSIYIFAI